MGPARVDFGGLNPSKMLSMPSRNRSGTTGSLQNSLHHEAFRERCDDFAALDTPSDHRLILTAQWKNSSYMAPGN